MNLTFKVVRHGSMAALAIAVVGCSAVAPLSRLDEVEEMAPERWVASKESRAGVDHEWVDRFNDRELSKLVDIGLAAAPDMRVARERVEQARQDVAISGAALKPSASFRMESRRNKVNFIGGAFSGSSVTDNNSSNFQVNWEPDVWGSKREATSAVIGELQQKGPGCGVVELYWLLKFVRHGFR